MATYYWVGGSGNTSDATNHWSTSSGGSPSAGNTPTSSDDVVWDSSSNGSGYTVTLNSTFTCRDFTLGAPASGSVTLAGTAAMNVYGSFSCPAGSGGATVTATSTSITFKATSGTKTIDANGVSFSTAFGGVTIDGVGGTFSLSNDFNTGGNWTTTNGTFTTNGYDIICGTFGSSNSNTRSVTIDNSLIDSTGWNFATTTNLTFSYTGSTIRVSTLSGLSFSGGGLTYADVELETGVNGTLTVVGSNTFGNLSVANIGQNQIISLTAGTTQTVSGTFTATGYGQGNGVYIQSATRGSTATINAAAISLTDCLFEDITGAGAASWSGTRVGNCGGNSGITFSSPVTRYWVGNGGSYSGTTHWSTSSGGSSGASCPLPQDTAIVDANSFSSGSQTLTIDSKRLGNWDFTGVDNSPALTLTASSFLYGDFIMDSGLGTVTTGAQTFRGRTQTMHLAGGGKSFSGNLTMDTLSTNTLQLTGSITTSGTFTHTSGSLDLNTYTCTSTTFSTSNSNTRAITFGTGGTIEVTSTGTVFTAATATGLTVTATGGVIKVSNASSSTKTVSGGGKTWGTLLWAVGTGTGNCDLVGSNTFEGIQDTGTAAHSLRFTAGTTTTLTSTTFPTGDASHTITIASITASGHTLSLSGGGTISCDYMSISRSTASPGTTWYAGTHSTDGGNNSGWTFTAPPGGSTEYSITPSSRYAITREIAVTKSSRYTVDTESAPTKTSKYTITTEIPVTKSSRYAVIVKQPMTVQAVYKVITEVPITKSSQYTVKHEQAVTLSSRYTVVALSSNAKFSTYSVITEHPITQSSRYTITTEHDVQKTSSYAVRNAYDLFVPSVYKVVSDVAVTKSTRYAIIEKTAQTLSSRYVVSAKTPITKTSVYRVKSEQTVTKTSAYCVDIESSLTKTSKYTVSIEHAITVASVYRVSHETAVTKQSIYRVSTENALTLGCAYIVGSVPRVTKSSKYTVYTEQVVTKSSTYCIETEPSAITKSSTYVIAVEQAITKSSRYAVKSEQPITKTSVYRIATETAQTKSSVYRIQTENSITKSSVYVVLALTETAITKTSVYKVSREHVTTLSSRYVITSAEFTVTKSSTYYILRHPYARQRHYTRQTNYFKY